MEELERAVEVIRNGRKAGSTEVEGPEQAERERDGREETLIGGGWVEEEVANTVRDIVRKQSESVSQTHTNPIHANLVEDARTFATKWDLHTN